MTSQTFYSMITSFQGFSPKNCLLSAIIYKRARLWGNNSKKELWFWVYLILLVRRYNDTTFQQLHRYYNIYLGGKVRATQCRLVDSHHLNPSQQPRWSRELVKSSSRVKLQKIVRLLGLNPCDSEKIKKQTNSLSVGPYWKRDETVQSVPQAVL